jgi:hypothetical protein
VAAYAYWCAQYDICADLTLGQFCHETGYGTSDRWKNEWNPSGLRIVADNTPPNPFPSLDVGIQAGIEHLCCHAFSEADCPCDHEHLADRYHAFHLDQTQIADIQTAPYRWAAGQPGGDPLDYVRSIVAIANSVGAAPVSNQPTIVDIRDQLQTNPNGGPAARSPKDGVIVHYNGPAVTHPGRQQLAIDAVYHCQEDWGNGARGDGIMYHVGIDENGTIYQCRDWDAVLWHCASWPENATYTSVQVTIGEGQHATPAALASLGALVDWLRARDGFGVDAVKGHQEVSATSCPGSLMGDFVYPYRAGTIGGTPVATGFKDDVTGHLVANAMFDFFTANGGVSVLGRPITEEVQDSWPDDAPGSPARTMQYFERDVLGFFPENQGQYRVQALRLGAKLARDRGYSGIGIEPIPTPLVNPNAKAAGE